MLENFTIHLRVPHCPHPTEELAWSIADDKSLVIECPTCRRKSDISYGALRARIMVVDPMAFYPVPKRLMHSPAPVQTSNVILFPPRRWQPPR